MRDYLRLNKTKMTPEEIKNRLAKLKQYIIDENISYGEIAELQSLAKYIDPSDTLLLEWAGVEENKKGKRKKYIVYTTSQCYTTYEVEAKNEKEAEEKVGEWSCIGEEFVDEQIEEITESDN